MKKFHSPCAFATGFTPTAFALDDARTFSNGCAVLTYHRSRAATGG